MVRMLTCGETLVGLATATASLPGFSTQSDSYGWILAAFLGLLPMAYRLTAEILARVTDEAPCLSFDEPPARSSDVIAPLS